MKNGSCLLNAYEFPGTDYCGRRFANSEDLLVHVKTHTNPSTSDPRALSMLTVSSAPASVAELAATSSLSSYNSLIAASSPYYKEAMMAYAAHQRMAAAAAALAAAPPGSAGGALPYVCNWVAGTATPPFNQCPK